MNIERRRYVMTARAAKAEAARARIKKAAARLYCERPIEDFTLEAVAAEAGVSVRTILRAFKSKDELVYAALEEVATSGAFLKPTPPGDVAAAVAAHFDIYEMIGDMVIQRLGEERRHPGLKPALDLGRANHRGAVQAMFEPELAGLDEAARARLLAMLVIITDVYVWKLLRRDMGLERPAAEALVEKMVISVMAGET